MVYKDSRYVQTRVYIHAGETAVLGIRNRNNFDMTNAVYYTVMRGDTLDGISYKQYGNERLGWAILDANPKYQSEIEIQPGDVIAIPPFDEVVRVCE